MFTLLGLPLVHIFVHLHNIPLGVATTNQLWLIRTGGLSESFAPDALRNPTLYFKAQRDTDSLCPPKCSKKRKNNKVP